MQNQLLKTNVYLLLVVYKVRGEYYANKRAHHEDKKHRAH